MKVTYLDGTTVEVESKQSDVIRFERHYDLSGQDLVNAAAGGTLRTDHFWFFGWCAAVRAGDERSYDEWWPEVVNVAIVSAPKAKRGTRTRKPSP